ncbi:alpha-1,4-glucan--maltose-1-phosphate maltosyltransferase [Rhodococcus sp. ARC_M6]|uniref:alpha-1,4-glucan--maltose-1-phosphate maltosyltransferase n=1 Tax=Rhodococcus sp. ARC_M6 TaxID=2928852 RepID=UPI001FB22835|nr:alpha-1,4-glucan--maltose-1-phosphate maltosyltransferase [Rhodococcus sp. ARC_M6]MCJ0903132.1 alpha-1,4-glucan--maltose-1-phosphate maltosyltransferase [Rhodococcus sp. ARC_M6]
MTGRLGIDDAIPAISGNYPAKAVVGEVIPVHATVWREGHDAVAATLVVRGPRGTKSLRITMDPGGEPDTVDAVFVPSVEGLWTFRIEAWSDPVATWKHAVEAKLSVGQGPAELANDLEIGARLFERAAQELPRANRSRLEAVTASLRSDQTLTARVAPAFASDVAELLRANPLRELVTKGESHPVLVDRHRALFGSWYEFFPRSTGGWDENGVPKHGTFKTSAEDLPRIAAMGFDVVYLPPIHPIGEINRKGRNNSLTTQPGDVGSPWAIGSAEGGHDAVHPELGTLEDFKAFVAQARKLDLEVALDLALQCAPDHPWAAKHPEWFTVLPDGTIAYAENPPKKYQDIYPINFDIDPDGLDKEILRVVRHWIKAGVKIFRVDNPHTKPPNFWETLISEVKKSDPDVLFLAEAFTRPARMYGLARRGFTQSYTYFTWRVAKWELTEFGNELAAKADEARPNLFVNTPDILHESLQHGGPGMFALRAALAATLAPTWGVYSGYELFEHQAVRPGSEEYLDSEKYELRPRRFAEAAARGESLEPWITALNRIRRAHPALQQLRNLHFHHIDNDALIAYSKFDPITGDAVLTIVNLNPYAAEDGTVWLDMPALGREWQDQMTVLDEVTGEQYHWGQANFVRLEPWRAVAHILALPPVPYSARTSLAYRGGN